ncbi:MAG: caspase family protein, partial [Pyrinomonadaceae bacterium]|nr:caspase family protein [Pyrinomonadaceae bacterium]
MKIKLTVTMIFTLLFSVIFPLPLPASAQTKPNKPDAKADLTGGRFALLVGINDYQDEEINDLGGCENDVRLMRELLMKEYGFKDDAANKNTKTLLSAQATRKAILAEFNAQLLVKAKNFYAANNLNLNKKDQGATVVFYYSGHGATLPDVDKDGNLANEEADGLDETIVPYDSKSDGENAIIDDEFDTLFNQLSEWTTNIVFIFDSCHSGTVNRSGNLTRRTEFKNYKMSVKLAEQIKSMQAKGRNVGSNENLTDGINDLAEEEKIGYVTISGCLPNQLSQEAYLTDPATKKSQQNGLLTFYLIQTLRRNPSATYNQVMQTVRKAVQTENPQQIPQIEGDIDRPVFNIAADSGARPKSIPFENLADKKIKLQAGKIVGAFEGGIVAVYSKDAMKLQGDDERIGSGTIEIADDFTSTVQISFKNPNLKEVPADAQIMLVTPYFGSAKRLIALDNSPAKTGNSADVMKRVTEFAKDEKFVTTKEINNPGAIADKDRTWDAAILRMTYKDFKFGNDQGKTKALTAPKDDDEVYVLADKKNMPLYNFYLRTTDEKAAEKINEALENHVRVENIRNFGNGAGGINDKLKLELVPVVAGKINPGTAVCPVAELTADKRVKSGVTEILKPGQQFYFKVTNDTGQDLYLYLYDIAPDGSVAWLFPDRRRNIDEQIADGKTINTFGKNQCYIFSITPPDRTAAPFGIETFKLIATTQKINGLLLESAAISKGARDGSSPLGQLLAQ